VASKVMSLAAWLLHKTVKDDKRQGRQLVKFSVLKTVLDENTEESIA
jgi:hypothetical protein